MGYGASGVARILSDIQLLRNIASALISWIFGAFAQPVDLPAFTGFLLFEAAHSGVFFVENLEHREELCELQQIIHLLGQVQQL